jgi:kinesin family protein 4/21/27
MNSRLGMVPRAIEELFTRLQQELEKDSEFNYTISVSFLELYNEELVDLLAPKGKNAVPPTIRENTNGKIIWSGITQEEVKSPLQLYQYINSTKSL